MTGAQVAFREALRAKRRAMTPTARARSRIPKVVPTLYPWAIERRYAALIASWMRPLVQAVNKYMRENGEALLRGDSAVRLDALPGPGFQLLLATLSGWVGQYFPDPIGGKSPSFVWLGIGEVSDAAKLFTAKQWGKQTYNLIGFEFGAPELWWKDVRDQWVANNYKLIQSSTRRYIDAISLKAEQAIINGWSYTDLMADIQALGDAEVGSRARLIARDQIGKLNGMINQAQQTEVGVTMYTWLTAGDERVRKSHAAMKNVLCRWDNPEVRSLDGGKTWVPRAWDAVRMSPGLDIQCRCVAVPYWGNMIEEADAGLAA